MRSTTTEKVKVGEKLSRFFMKIIDNSGGTTSSSNRVDGGDFKVQSTVVVTKSKSVHSHHNHNQQTQQQAQLQNHHHQHHHHHHTQSGVNLSKHKNLEGDESTEIVNYNASTNSHLYQSKKNSNNAEVSSIKSETSSHSSFL
jgi:ABC-type Zn2+ transport system substrate-binding protein/surface adhesin